MLHELNKNQKIRLFEVASTLFSGQSNPFLERIVTVDKNCVLYDNHRSSTQWLDHNDTRPNFAKPKLHRQKCMVAVSAGGLIHHSFLNSGEAITSSKWTKLTKNYGQFFSTTMFVA